MQIAMPLGTNSSLVAVRVRVAFHFPDAFVLDRNEEGAAVAATIADSRNARHRGGSRGFTPRFQPERPRGQGSGSQSRTLEKRAT